jgi:hypothetical protein
VERRVDVVQVVVAEDRVFPAHRIVQCVGAGVAPVAVEIVFGQCGSRAGEFEQFVGSVDGDLGGEDLGFNYVSCMLGRGGEARQAFRN